MAKPRTARNPLGAGAPGKFGRPARRAPNPTDPDTTLLLTHEQALIDRVRLGLDLKAACSLVGLSLAVAYQWMTRGGRALALEAQGHPVPEWEAPFARFVEGIERAWGEAEVARLGIIQRAAQGGAVVTRTTVRYDAAGDEVERTVVTETLRPEWTAAAWWLERRMPGKYRRRSEVVVEDDRDEVAAAASMEERLATLAEALRRQVAALPAAPLRFGSERGHPVEGMSMPDLGPEPLSTDSDRESDPVSPSHHPQ